MSEAGRHSLHPIAVGVPLLAWSTSLAFDAISYAGHGRSRFARFSERAMIAGLIGAGLSGVYGLRDLVRFSASKPAARPLATFHATLNFCAIGFYSLAALRRGAIATEGSLDSGEGSVLPDAGRVTLGDVWSNAGALAVLAVSGYVGGRVAQRFDVEPGLEP